MEECFQFSTDFWLTKVTWQTPLHLPLLLPWALVLVLAVMRVTEKEEVEEVVAGQLAV